MKGYTYFFLFVIFLALLIYFCVVEGIIIRNSRTDSNPERGYIIVLGAKVRGLEPSVSLRHRLEAALSYLNSYPNSKVIVSGGQGADELISEAQCMRDWLTANGIDEARILMENQSSSTLENLNNSKALIIADGGNAEDVAILSSPYHLYRAKLMARSLGMNPAGVACVNGLPCYTVGMYVREAFGVTHLWILGN